jgi:hypothetical protein
MKQFEKEAVEYAKQFTKDWDYAIVAMDAYMAGYRAAKKDLDPESGNKQVDMALEDGTHQLTEATFRKWKQEKEFLKIAEEVMKKHHKIFERLALND